MRIRTVAVIFVMLCVAVGWGSSQPAVVRPAVQQAATPADAAKPQTRIDPAKEGEIRRMLELVGAKRNLVEMMELMSKDLRSLLVNSLPPGHYRQSLADLSYTKLQSKADIEEALNVVIPIYDKYYSRDEIEGLIKLYEMPVAQKSFSLGPKVIKEMFETGLKWGGKLYLDFVQEILAEHPEMAESVPVKISAGQKKPSTLSSNSSPARTNIDPVKEAEIRRLIDVSGGNKLTMEYMQIFGKALQSDPANPFQGRYRETLTDLYVKYIFQSHAGYLVELTIPVYDKYFSREEIETVIKLYETPLGQKSVSVVSQLMKEGSEKLGIWYVNLLGDSVQEVLVEHPELAEALEAARKAAEPK